MPSDQNTNHVDGCTISTPFTDEVASRLRSAGAKHEYVDRLCTELECHADQALRELDGPDLVAAEAFIRDRLGEPDSIVEAALADTRNLKWSRRAPYLMFGLLPLAAIPIAFIAFCLALVASAELADLVTEGDLDGSLAPFFQAHLFRCVQLVAIGVPVLIAARFARYARESGAKPRFCWLALLMLALAGAMTEVSLALTDAPDSQFSLSFLIQPPTSWQVARLVPAILSVCSFAIVFSRKQESQQ